MTFNCPATKRAALDALEGHPFIDCLMDSKRISVRWLRARELVRAADSVAWKSHDLGHELEVVAGGNVYLFDVKMPLPETVAS